ncbi:MAG: DUF3500 domain-containing protein [Thermomicrobiales bacterium]
MAVDMALATRAPLTAGRMAEAAKRFLASLSEEQRAQAAFEFAGDERYFWHYTPIDRNGLRLGDMTDEQRELAYALFDASMSGRGAAQAKGIIALEPILKLTEETENIPTQWLRDSARYRWSIFGEPGGKAPWAWRAGGHHIGISFTVVDGDWVASTPLFLGANPVEVRHGESKGLRSLLEEEEYARTLLASLTPVEKAVAVVNEVAPADILSTNLRRAEPEMAPLGIPYADLGGEQREHLVRLIRHYATRTADEVAENTWREVERAGLDGVGFAWAGPEERGQGHYYAVKGPRFLIEYDNTQNNANHIHSVWRDYANDWGEDLLAAHYAETHSHGDHAH